jgi:hypothetical protein
MIDPQLRRNPRRIGRRCGALACAALSASLLALACAFPAAADSAQAPVEVRTPWPPAAVPGRDGLAHLAYELHITNFYRSGATLRLHRIEVYADDAAAPLANFEGERLQRLLGPEGAGDDAAKALAIAGGQRAIAFVWLDLSKGQNAPRSLRHRIEFRDDMGASQFVDGARVAINTDSPVVLGAPLREGRWFAYEGPSNSQSHHWGSVVAVDGQVTIPQRYAMDLIGLDARGHAVRKGVADFRKSRHSDWIGYAAPVIAVADGEVQTARDGEGEHAPLAPQTEPASLSADALYGNYVILKIAPSVYVHYAHLRPGSVAVKTGERVRKGQLLGALGQSGSSGGPHLHLHVSNSANFEGSEGLPFVFDRFGFDGTWTIDRALAPDSALAPGSQTHERQMPVDNDVIEFQPQPHAIKP